MASIGTFGSFTQARLAIYASQTGLTVTGNNIANINTEGYTRQRLDQKSFNSHGADRYYAQDTVRVGNGVLPTGLSQLRDPYLDIRYRSQMSNVGAMDTKLAGLEDIQAVLDEVGDGDAGFGVLEAQLSELYDAFQKLADQTGHAEYDLQARAVAESIVKQFNAYADDLEEVYRNADTDFRQDLKDVNGILENIRDLNATIRKAEIHGDEALELRDERNLLIDRLSEYMKVDVIYTEEDIGAGQTVEKLTIKLGNANPDAGTNPPTDETVLIDGIYGRQMFLVQVPEPNPAFDSTLPAGDTNRRYLKADGTTTNNVNLANQVDSPNYDLGLTPLEDSKGRDMIVDPNTNPVTRSEPVDKLDDNDLYGALQSQRELLTETGEFASQETINNVDESAASKRGIPYYQKVLDLLANKFAAAFNDANQGYYYDKDGQYLTQNGSTILAEDGSTILTRTNVEQFAKNAGMTVDAYLEQQSGEKPVGAPLFSIRSDKDDTEGILASNISVSKSWYDGPQIVRSFLKPFDDMEVGSTDSTNIDHLINLFTTKMDYIPRDVDEEAPVDRMFNGTFQEMWTEIGATLGNDMDVTTTQLDTYYAQSVELGSDRDAYSSVDLNDEAMNMMQYSKSYNAACRLMTTIDTVLDKLINGTGATR